MRILLPPSETKRDGGTHPPLEPSALVWADALGQLRERLIDELASVSASVEEGRAALGLSERQAVELAHNLELRSSPTMPAIERYTGVLYDALGVDTLDAAARRRVDEQVLVGSALFGLVAAGDPIPRYRMSAAARLPGVGPLAPHWRQAATPIIDEERLGPLVIDMRSGAYRALVPVPHAVGVEVASERPDGTRRVVSHANKQTRGEAARILVQQARPPAGVDEVIAALADAGLRVEQPEPQRLVVVLAG